MIQIQDLDPTRFAKWLFSKIQPEKTSGITDNKSKIAILSISAIKTLRFDSCGNIISSDITSLFEECLEGGYEIYVVSARKEGSLDEWDERWARRVPLQNIYMTRESNDNLMFACEPWERLFKRLGLIPPSNFGGMKPHWMDWQFAAEAQGIKVA